MSDNLYNLYNDVRIISDNLYNLYNDVSIMSDNLDNWDNILCWLFFGVINYYNQMSSNFMLSQLSKLSDNKPEKLSELYRLSDIKSKSLSQLSKLSDNKPKKLSELYELSDIKLTLLSYSTESSDSRSMSVLYEYKCCMN